MWTKAFRSEWTLIRSHWGAWALPWLFFGLVITVMLFALGPFEPELQRFVPRLMVIVALMALFMQTDQLFKPDARSGCLALYWVAPVGWGTWLGVRLFLMGMILVLPLVIWAGLAAWLAQVPGQVILALIIAMGLAMPSLYLLTALTAALTVALPQAGLLNAMIVLPLYLPILLLMQTLVVRSQWDEAYGSLALVLGLILVVLLLILPWAIQRCLRLSLR